ncbi:MAG: FumA C-terminus/TtdB family hydratase beta subunit [Thermoplasmata archaeon]
MTEKRVLRTPLDSSTIRALKIGDIVYLTGRVFTARDQAHMLMLRTGIPKELDTRGLAVYHCGPIVKNGPKGPRITSAGPTTSMRMESLQPRFLELSGAMAVIGKGGMGPSTLEALEKLGAVYLSITGGLGALAMKQLGDIKAVHFLEELGPVEAVWEFDAEEFGPLVVTMDSHGNSLHEAVSAVTLENLARVLGGL